VDITQQQQSLENIEKYKLSKLFRELYVTNIPRAVFSSAWLASRC